MPPKRSAIVTRNRVLPDTCAWIDFFRGSGTPLASTLRAALAEGAVLCCGVVLYELLRGAKGEAEKEKLVSVFDGLPQLDVSGETWIEAGLLASKLRGKGQTLPMSDVLIATLALKHGAVVLTIDRHFFAVEGLIVRSEA